LQNAILDLESKKTETLSQEARLWTRLSHFGVKVIIRMKKAKAKSTGAAKKAAKKNFSRTKSKKEVDLVEVRKDIANIVGTKATKMVRAVIRQGQAGQLAPVKYLLEAAGVFPAAPESDEGKLEQDSLARTLLRRMGLPEDPVVPAEEEAQPVLRKKAEQPVVAPDSGNEQNSELSAADGVNGEQAGAAQGSEGSDTVE
jgi:hypothetical protein